MKKKSFLRRLKPRLPGEDEPVSGNVRKASNYADRFVKAVRWLLNED